MDKDWRFHRGEVECKRVNSHSESYSSCKAGNLRGPGGREWNDSEWDAVDLPHDYLSEATFGPDNLISHGYRERQNAWYRKSFLLDEALCRE